jgi:hypothetical protein
VPWIECIALAYGKAAKVYTVDFNKPISDMPEFNTMSIPELEESDLKFDAIVSYSSLEHDGKIIIMLAESNNEIRPW